MRKTQKISLDEYKFNAEILRNFGFALMTPFGAMAFNILIGVSSLARIFSLRLFVALALTFCGFLIIMRASATMEERDARINQYF